MYFSKQVFLNVCTRQQLRQSPCKSCTSALQLLKCLQAYLPTNSTILAIAPHLSLAKWPSFFLQSRDDSGPCKGKGTVHILLYFVVGITHLGNQHIQQNHKHSNQEGHVHDNREPAGGEGREGLTNVHTKPANAIKFTLTGIHHCYHQHNSGFL